MLPVESLRNHVLSICRAFSINLLEVPGMPLNLSVTLLDTKTVTEVNAVGAVRVMLGGAVLNRTIQIPPITSDVVYAVALHELGHNIHPTGLIQHHYRESEWTLGLAILQEEAATEWARQNALIWTPAMQKALDDGLESYLRAFEEEQMKRRRQALPRRTESIADFIRRIPK